MESCRIRLQDLLMEIPGITVCGSQDVEICGLCNNSKFIKPGDVFFAKKGTKCSGTLFIEEAVQAGAVAVVTDCFISSLSEVVQVIHQDVLALEAMLADRFYRSPTRDLLTIGVTGTNGKTTSVYMIQHLLRYFGYEMGLLGTVEWIIKDAVQPATLTTPDLLTTQNFFYKMREAGCRGGVMEVSSHALEQGRVRGLDFDVALHTNITQDHLDYHKTMESYAGVKAQLFTFLRNQLSIRKKEPKIAVINEDCPWAFLMKKNIQVPVITYGFSSEASLQAFSWSLSAEGSACGLRYFGQELLLQTSLIGKFNLYNCLGVIAVGLALGLPFKEVVLAVSSFASVRGRLEKVENSLCRHIFVDYAHTEDALKNVLEALRDVTKGKILCVFGCGGDRDRAKRPKMGAIVARLADKVFVTSDNPRSEDPKVIIEEILGGMQDLTKVQVEVDRKKAIALAVQDLSSEDILLIAGKGHENYQIFHDHTIHFDDRIVAKEYCR